MNKNPSKAKRYYFIFDLQLNLYRQYVLCNFQ